MWLQHKVDAGLFPDLAAAAHAALQQQAIEDVHLNWQRAEVLKGLESLEKYGTIPYDPQKIRDGAWEIYQTQKSPLKFTRTF
jgi:hypothetical protein